MRNNLIIYIIIALVFSGFFFAWLLPRSKIKSNPIETPDTVLSKEEADLKIAKKGFLTVSTIADADAWVESGSVSTNFGDYTWVYIGRSAAYGNDEGYYRFPLSDKPENYVNACITLHFNYVPTTFNFPVYLIEAEWDELTITWNNKPAYSTLITTLTISTSGIYKINVTDYIEGRNNISISVSYDSSKLAYTSTNSREDTLAAPNELPQIIWTYETEFGYNITRPNNKDSLNFGNHKIEWKSVGASSSLYILLYNDSVYVQNITDYTINDGEYIWNIPSSANFSGDKYQIKLIDLLDNQIFNFSDYFEIKLFILPNTGEPDDDDDSGGGDNKEAIPLGNYYLIFILISIVVGIFLTKKKLLKITK